MHIQFITNLPKRNGVHPDTSLPMDRKEVNPMQKAITKGFTLIELLVVIAIIGILAAVVLVAINPAERIAESNDSKTKSNIGQVATAMESCYTANQGTYAAGSCDSTANLSSAGFLKQDLGIGWPNQAGSVHVVQSTTAGQYLISGVMTAKSNINGGTTCSGTNHSYMQYHTSTGSTDSKGGSCVASEPTAP
jgi:prepilin-type N-terminal cleavage/methylation domain-containing protein